MAENHSSDGGISHVQMVRGFPFPAPPMFNKKAIEDCLDYVPRDGDIVMAAYPKTGQTWLEYIVLQILTKAEAFPSFDELTVRIVPYIEMVGIQAVEALKEPRMYKHHCPYNMVQKNDNAKCLYIYRNPEDTVVSFYHFSQEMSPRKISFDQFFDNFCTGNIGYGSYFGHILSFYAHKNDPNLLLVSYEKLHANRKEEILRIAKFLGEEYYTFLREDESLFNKIIEHTSFDYMKKNLTLTHPDVLLKGGNQEKDAEKKTVNFFRKGIIGDGKAVLSAEQQKRLRDEVRKRLAGTEFIKEWLNE